MNINGMVIERSHRHIHLTEKTAELLFGLILPPVLLPLTVSGEYATNLQVSIPEIGTCKALYPWRPYNQLELAMSEYYRLFKVFAKRVMSGDHDNARTIVIGTGRGHVEVPVIVPAAHVHSPFRPVVPFPLKLEVKLNETVDGLPHVHLDNDQFNAVMGL